MGSTTSIINTNKPANQLEQNIVIDNHNNHNNQTLLDINSNINFKYEIEKRENELESPTLQSTVISSTSPKDTIQFIYESDRYKDDPPSTVIELEYNDKFSKSFHIQTENYEKISLESSSPSGKVRSTNSLNKVIPISRTGSDGTIEIFNQLNLLNSNQFNNIADCNLDYSRDSDTTMSIRCDLCDLEFSNEEDYFYHINYSKKHWINSKEKNEY